MKKQKIKMNFYYILWIVSVIIWNFGFPTAEPYMDVVFAVIIPFFIRFPLKIFKKIKSNT